MSTSLCVQNPTMLLHVATVLFCHGMKAAPWFWLFCLNQKYILRRSSYTFGTTPEGDTKVSAYPHVLSQQECNGDGSSQACKLLQVVAGFSGTLPYFALMSNKHARLHLAVQVDVSEAEMHRGSQEMDAQMAHPDVEGVYESKAPLIFQTICAAGCTVQVCGKLPKHG